MLFLLGFSCQKSKHTVMVTAHRGASGLAPENTMSAMLKAIEIGSDYAELDVQETRDGVLVLLHDSSLKRTAKLDMNIWEIYVYYVIIVTKKLMNMKNQNVILNRVDMLYGNPVR